MRKRTKLRLCALAAASLAGAALGPWAIGARAQDVGALQSKIDDAQAQAQGLAAQIDSNQAALSEAQARAQAAAAREAQLTAVLAESEQREAELTQKVDAAADQLDQTRAELQEALDALADRLVAIYKGDMPDAATVLLSSQGFDDLATRAEYLQRVETADAELAARVRTLRDQVAAQLDALEEAKAEVAAFNDRLEQARAEIAEARAEAEAQAAAFAAARASQADALASLRAQVDDWTQQVQEAQQVSAAEAQQTVGSWFGDWAIPEAIVMCESGGNFNAVNQSSGAGGAYQILPSTWESYGGEGKPNDASPQEQHDIAQQIWEDSGPSAWVCAG
ncbi:MAG TPA: transglycosylase family protein [Solirubrobacterales bacterium]|nr:transglycosylase family protein [Solirubrobacterales bacterium]